MPHSPLSRKRINSATLETGDNSTVVTATISSGAGTLLGTTTVTVIDGVATFAGLGDKTAGPITITFASGNLTTATTGTIVINPAAASQLVVTQEPSSTAVAGAAFTTQPIVAEEDKYGNVITGDSTSKVTAARGSVGTASLQGNTLTVTLVDGVAKFAGLSYDKAEPMDIGFSSNVVGVSVTSSNNIAVSPATASQLVINQQPSPTATAGLAFASQPVVYEEDQFNNIETGDNSTVITAMLSSGAGPIGGTATATVSGGVARFSNLADKLAETAKLDFTSGTMTSLPSNAIVVSPATAEKLVIAVEPSSTATAGQAFAVQPVVYVEDAEGNIVTSDNSTLVSVALASGNGLPEGTTSVTVKDGIATFAGLNEITAGTIALEFSGDGLTAGPSSNIVITPAAPFRLKIATQPSPTATAGQAFATQPVIEELDLFGNIVTTDSSTVITAAISFGNGPLVGTATATLAGGVATFTNLADTSIGTISLGFSGNGLSVGPTNNIVISPGTATQLVILTQPFPAVTAGNALTDPIVVAEEDQYGNIITSDNSTQVTASLHSGTGTLNGTKTATVVNGIASFSDLEDDMAGTLSLQFAAPGVPDVISKPSMVSPGPAAIIKVVGKPPSGVIAGISFGGFVVDVMDNYGNLETSFNGPVTAALATGSSGTLGGTPTVDAVSGEATFGNLVADTSGPISLTATSNATGTSLMSPPPVPVVVSSAPADHFVVTTTFANTDVAGSDASVSVTAEDQFGNVASSGPDQYLGTVNLSTTDIQATGLPASYTLTAGDSGLHTFTGVLLATAGSHTITATDSADSGTTGTSLAIDVVPATVNSFVVSTGFTNPDVAGTVGTVTVTAKDRYGNTVGNGPNEYLGTVDLTSTDTRAGGLGASHIFSASDAGSYTFTGIVLKTAGTQTVTATDSITHAVTGNVPVNVVAAPVQSLVVTTNFPTIDGAGTIGTVTITAFDAYGNVASSGLNQYEGTVDLTNTDGRATGLSPSYMFTASDHGSHTFSDVSLVTPGSQTITATDSVNRTLTSITTVNVVPAAIKDFVVTTTFSNPDVAGTVGTVSVTAKDAYGNTVGSGPNQYEGTVRPEQQRQQGGGCSGQSRVYRDRCGVVYLHRSGAEDCREPDDYGDRFGQQRHHERHHDQRDGERGQRIGRHDSAAEFGDGRAIIYTGRIGRRSVWQRRDQLQRQGDGRSSG